MIMVDYRMANVTNSLGRRDHNQSHHHAHDDEGVPITSIYILMMYDKAERTTSKRFGRMREKLFDHQKK